MATPVIVKSIREFVVQRLNENKGQWRTIADQCDVALTTLTKIAREEVSNPGTENVEPIANYFGCYAVVLDPPPTFRKKKARGRS